LGHSRPVTGLLYLYLHRLIYLIFIVQKRAINIHIYQITVFWVITPCRIDVSEERVFYKM